MIYKRRGVHRKTEEGVQMEKKWSMKLSLTTVYWKRNRREGEGGMLKCKKNLNGLD